MFFGAEGDEGRLVEAQAFQIVHACDFAGAARVPVGGGVEVQARPSYDGSVLVFFEHQLGELQPHLPLVRLRGDVKNLGHLRATFAAHRPQVIFHAAAFKHVPLMEDENAGAALQNNLVGRGMPRPPPTKPAPSASC